jgi:Predicted metal-dependent hydrolase of the TIM-barrel fold
MIIDFHTHIFPEQIAARTISKLAEVGGTKAFTDGTICGLKRSMQENHVDISVVLPVATKPSQFDTINSYAAEITGKDKIISFGGIHPDTEDYRDKLDQIKRMGLLGIKLHPDYQQTFINDLKMVRLIQYAAEIGLIVSIHAGMDVGLPDPVHCPPKLAAQMISEIDQPDAKIVLAHMGGYAMWEEVEELLVGKNIYLDTGYTLGKMPDEQFMRIVNNHGADRILFATDSPWDGQGEASEYLKRLNLTEEEQENILYKNALKLLGLADR